MWVHAGQGLILVKGTLTGHTLGLETVSGIAALNSKAESDLEIDIYSVLM